MHKNKHGKYDVLNTSNCEWFEVDEEWFDGIDLKNVQEVRFSKPHGTDNALEVINTRGISTYYFNKYGSWVLDY